MKHNLENQRVENNLTTHLNWVANPNPGQQHRKKGLKVSQQGKAKGRAALCASTSRYSRSTPPHQTLQRFRLPPYGGGPLAALYTKVVSSDMVVSHALGVPKSISP